MTNPLQIALSVRSDYSLGESSFQIDKIIQKASDLSITHVALTDYMTISSMPTFSEKAKKAGITPIAGVTLQIVDDPVAKLKDRENNGYRLKVYPKNDNGMRHIFAALTKSLTEDNFYYHARLGLDDVLAMEDVIVTSGDIHSLWKHHNYVGVNHALAERFGADYYVEVVAIDTPLFDRLNQIAMQSAQATDTRVIITRPSFYATAGDADAADVLRAITSNTPTDSIFLARPYNRDLFLQAPVEMLSEAKRAMERADKLGGFEPLAKFTSCFTNLQELVEKCQYRFEKMAPSLPKMAENEYSALMAAVAEGWKKRFSRWVWGHRPEDFAPYKERLKFELAVIQKMGFSGYFLLVQDIVGWSKENGVMVGPGRGSAGGSLVAYLMGITDIDPIRFDLLFERFINPDRTDLPDIDLDFESAKRHMVVDYIINKYGRENVAAIVNFSTLGAASALRDTARLHGLDPWEYACSKQMEKEHGVSLGLSESADKVPDIDKFRLERPVLWDYALRLEGANRSLSQHAAGIIVTAEPVLNRAVVSTRGGELPVVQWDKRQVENFGLIKMDILGLSTLDLISCALNYIKERHKKVVDVLALPLDDELVLRAFAKGDTVGVFQFSGGGMRNLLKQMAEGGPLDFNDLCAATALFRPGPLDAGMCDRYVQVKRGAAVPHYEHPLLEECLGDTFGVVVYQEQVMKICRVLAGMSPGDADSVRKAMGKKDAVKMAEYKEKFIDGAVVSGMAAFSADSLWETIAGFAGYGFNKSHAAEYSLLSWVTMWIKVYYPAEFFAAAMTIIDDEAKLAPLVMDAQSRKLQVLPPDLNKSSARIEIEGEDKLYAPFQAVKGVSANTAAAIVKLRDDCGGFRLIAPATTRMVKKRVGPPVEEAVPVQIYGLTSEDQKRVLGRSNVGAAVLDKLGRVGALYVLTGEGVAPMHPDRVKDRIELCPGFTVDMVKPSRELNAEHLAKIKITSLIEEIGSCDGCSLKGAPHPLPRMGSAPRFMLVFDSPNWKEERAGKMLEGDAALVVKSALKDVGLKPGDGYYTSLVKSVKPKEAKMLTNEMINGCSQWLKKEIEILRPPVIIAMGSNAVRYFSPGIKGTPADLAGKVVYDAELDASIVFGINPGSLFHDPSKITLVQKTFAALGELLA